MEISAWLVYDLLVWDPQTFLTKNATLDSIQSVEDFPL